MSQFSKKTRSFICLQGTHNSRIYDKCQTGSAKCFALPSEQACTHDDTISSNWQGQNLCRVWHSSYTGELWPLINEENPIGRSYLIICWGNVGSWPPFLPLPVAWVAYGLKGGWRKESWGLWQPDLEKLLRDRCWELCRRLFWPDRENLWEGAPWLHLTGRRGLGSSWRAVRAPRENSGRIAGKLWVDPWCS